MDTLLGHTNSVLTRLREDKVTTVEESAYSQLIAEFVKQAVSEVEDASTWTQLRTTVQVPVIATVYDYVLTGAGSSYEILGVYEDLTDYRLRPAPSYQWMNRALLDNNRTVGPPEYWDINGFDLNGDPLINLFPVPDSTYSVNVNLKIKSNLQVDSDLSPVPSLPVVLRALFLAVEERGDDDGPSLGVLDQGFTNALASAVQLDEALHPEETVWFEE